MKSGKVQVSDLLGANNRIFKAGEEINEEQVPRGKWDKMVQGGYIIEEEAELVDAESRPATNKGKGK